MNIAKRVAYLLVSIVLTIPHYALGESCLVPRQTGEPPLKEVYSTREGLLARSEDSVLVALAHSDFDQLPISTRDGGNPVKVAKVYDTEQGVFILGMSGDGLSKPGYGFYRYVASPNTAGRLETLFSADERKRLRFFETTDGSFVTLSKQVQSDLPGGVYRLDGRTAKMLRMTTPGQLDEIEVKDTGQQALVGSWDTSAVPGYALYRVQDGDLVRVTDWTFGPVFGARSLGEDIVVWSSGEIYRLGLDSTLELISAPIPGLSIADFCALPQGVFAATSRGLFHLSKPQQLSAIPSSEESGRIYSLHNLSAGTYAVAANGVFRITGAGSLETSHEIESVREGLEYSGGVLISSYSNTHYLRHDGKLVDLPSPASSGQEEEIISLIRTELGILLTTESRVYRLSLPDLRWLPVPSEDLGGNIAIVTGGSSGQVCPMTASGPISEPSIAQTETDPGRVFVLADHGLFEWLDSPLEHLKIVFPPSLVEQKRPRSLRTLSWELQNIPCALVPGAVLQLLSIEDPSGEVSNYLPEARAAASLPWSVNIPPDQTRVEGKYRVELVVAASEDLQIPQPGTVDEPSNTVSTIESLHPGTVHRNAKTFIVEQPWIEKLIATLRDNRDILLGLALALSAFILLYSGPRVLRTTRLRWIAWREPERLLNRIFISYRRKDAGGHARALYTALCERFSDKLVFYDLDTLEFGEKFPEQLASAIQNCYVMLVVIAHDWVNVVDDRGTRRLDKPDDFVHMEIKLALEQQKALIPVLVGGATMPEARDLPKALKPLVEWEAITLGGKAKEYQAQINVLADKLAKFPDMPRPNRTRHG